MCRPVSPYTAVLLACLLATDVIAQPVANDPTFDVADAGFGQGDGFTGDVSALTVQPDGKVLVAGLMHAFSGSGCNRIARLDPDGGLDASFANTAPGYNGNVQCIALREDGMMYIGGSFIGIPGSFTYGVARLNSDGSPDPDFTTVGAISVGVVYAMAVQPDGKLIVAGVINNLITPYVDIVRLNSDGSLDGTFNAGTGTGIAEEIYALVLQPDGRIVIGGGFDSFNGIPCGHIARLNPDGTVDTSFDTGVGFDNTVQTLALRPDGRIIAGGWFGEFDGSPVGSIAQLNNDGSLDPSFDTGTGADEGIYSLLLCPDDDVIAGGAFGMFNGAVRKDLVKLNMDGSVDTGLDAGMAAHDAGDSPNGIWAIARRPDGRVLVGGHFRSFANTGRGNIAQVHADGSLDHDFCHGTGFNQQPKALALLPDGHILVAGDFHSFSDTCRRHIALLTASGNLETSFDPDAGFDFSVHSLALQGDGKVIAGGHFQHFNDVACGHIARLNADGSLDGSFGVGSGFEYDVNALVIQPDGKLLVGGDFTSFNGGAQGRLVRLEEDGSPDAGFAIGTGFSGAVHCIALLPDGHILVGGNFVAINGIARNRIARLNPDGSLDPSFDPGGGFDQTVRALALQPDGKVIVGGSFLGANGISRNYIARLNPNGSLDLTYDPGTGFSVSGAVYSLALQSNGYVIAGGDFSFFNGVYRKNIARLTPGGQLDMGFGPGTGFNSFDQYTNGSRVNALLLQPDGALLVGGEFLRYDVVGRNRIARLTPGPCTAGAPCDDGLASTSNDVYDANCMCAGTSGCIPSQLTTTADPVISCGAVNLKFDGTSTIAATEVSGANKYQFRFTNIPGQPAYARNIAWPTRSFTLTQWYTSPLKPGRIYNVTVRASFDNGATWCDWGPSCTVQVGWSPFAPGMVRDMVDAALDAPELEVYPNPTNGDQLRMQVNGLGTEVVSATLDITDLSGRRVMGRTLPLQDGSFNTIIELETGMADGLYIVTITTGGSTLSERLVVAR